MGKVRYENGYRIKDHKTEIEVADQLRERLGGKIVLLKEANTQGAKHRIICGAENNGNLKAYQPQKPQIPQYEVL